MKRSNKFITNLFIYFVRHGHTDKDCQHGDLCLSDTGKKQAELLSFYLKDEEFETVYTSNLMRAYETARIILNNQRKSDFIVTEALQEITHYHFTPGPVPRKRDIVERYRKEKETVNKFCTNLIKKHNKGGKVLIVTHGNIIRVLVAYLAGRNPKTCVPFDLAHASLTIMIVGENGGVLHELGSIAHLPRDLVTW